MIGHSFFVSHYPHIISQFDNNIYSVILKHINGRLVILQTEASVNEKAPCKRRFFVLLFSCVVISHWARKVMVAGHF